MHSSTPRLSYGDRLANLTERAVDLASLPDARARLGALADTIEALGADPAPDGQPNFWFDIVCPEATSFKSNRLYQNMMDWNIKSSCALVERSTLRRLGKRAPELGLDASGTQHAYMDGRAVENIYVVGGTSNPNTAGDAWVVAGTEPPPVGVICLIGEGGAEHVFTTRVVTDTLIESIDGGQVIGTIPGTNPPKGYQGIERKQRSWAVQGSHIFVDGRRLIGWLDPNLLTLEAATTYDLI